jgi:DNA-binding transcriptional ArsR family regulator
MGTAGAAVQVRTVPQMSNGRSPDVLPAEFDYSRTVVTGTRELAHPDAGELHLTEVLAALGEPTRLSIVRQLAAEGPLEVAACQALGGDLPKSTKSHHLKVLREAGVIRNEPSGRQRFVSIRRDDLQARFPGLLDSVLASAPAQDDTRPLDELVQALASSG